MTPVVSKRFVRASLFVVAAVACGGGGDSGTPPVTVASVTITSPAAAPNFGALGRTVQFSAVAKDANGAAIPGATITWGSSTSATATVSGSGLVTAVANGTTNITASSGGQSSTPVTVTVAQVPTQLVITGAPFTMGAIGSVRNLVATAQDSGGAAITTTGVAWSLQAHGAPNGPTVTLSPTGTMTAIKNTATGLADSLTAAVTVASVPLTRTSFVTVAQVANTVTLSVPAGDSVLRTTTRTRQLTPVISDSNGNALTNNPAQTWSSSATGVATVSNTGLVTAVADGSSNIQVTVNGKNATRVQLVGRYAQTFTLTPPTSTISVANGTQLFTGVAQDSVSTALTITWVTRPNGILTITPATGTSTTATARGNGVGYVVMSAGLRSDSSAVTTSNQPIAPSTIDVTVGDDFFKSQRNLTTSPSIDTVAAGGTVTWHWTGAIAHTVQSLGSPSFASSTNLTQTTGTYVVTFNNVGTYSYDCQIHGLSMSGTIVVR
jgi:plastocyanin/uncharacterized protein YjdB